MFYYLYSLSNDRHQNTDNRSGALAKSTTKSTITSPAKAVCQPVKDSRYADDEIQGRTTIDVEQETIQQTESASSAKSTARKRKSYVPNSKQQQENKHTMESKIEPKSVGSSPSPLSAKSQSGCTKIGSPFENRPTIEEGSEPSKLSPPKREANERLKSPETKSTVQSLEQEINERKAECQTANATSNNKSKLSDALDKLVYKQKEKEQQQQQKQSQKIDKQSKRLPQHLEANKSPVDMDIEPKESNERDKNNPVPNESQIQNVVNEIDKLADASNQSDVSGERDQLRFGTDKYEQEQFVNNMPKPPTPKSSRIFSPPPTSLTIDKREASIFDFADNFPIPNDSSVSLLSFNSDNLFKEDSAKETMDLVANLRQNIKKGGKGDDSSKIKSESVNQTQTIESETSPDSTTDINIKSNTSENTTVSQSIDTTSKAGVSQQPTLVIDLDQEENSGDESKLPQLNEQINKKPSNNDSNWAQNAHLLDKNRGNILNVGNLTSSLQLQTEVEQIASKLSNEMPTPTDFVICNELNESQNINAFNMQPYVCNSFNGNKEAFERQAQTQLQVSDLLFFFSISFSIHLFQLQIKTIFVFLHPIQMKCSPIKNSQRNLM